MDNTDSLENSIIDLLDHECGCHGWLDKHQDAENIM